MFAFNVSPEDIERLTFFFSEHFTIFSVINVTALFHARPCNGFKEEHVYTYLYLSLATFFTSIAGINKISQRIQVYIVE